jgi:hypothetical protein
MIRGMTTHLRSRSLLSAALLTCLVAVSGQAGTGSAEAAPAASGPVSSPYTCSAEALNGNTLDISFALTTTAPAKIYVGKSHTPTLVVKATIPGNIVFLASVFGVKSASATGTVTVKINGVASSRQLLFPRTDIPQSAQAFPVTINVGLPKLSPTAVGSVTYKPGPVALTLEGYNKTVAAAAAGDSVGTIAAECTSKAPNQVIDTVSFVRSATRIAGKLTSVPGKKVRATATVTATSGIVPVGTMTAKVFRGKKLLATRKATLAKGAVAAVFPKPAKKGRYKVVISYAGSKAHLASSTAKTFRIR